MTDVISDTRERGPRPLRLILLFAAIAVLMAVDLADDLGSRTDPLHLALETAVFSLAAGGAVLLWREVAEARAEAVQLGRDLQAAQADAQRWRDDARDALAGLGAAMGRQFTRWSLTDAERGVALLLLQGLSHKEIASSRDTGERTVRQQALAIYRKAGVHSRAELAAFFLRDVPPASAG